MIILLSAVIVGLIVFLLYAILHINKLQKQVNLLDKEQHSQNQDIIKLMRSHMTHQEMLLQHIEILKYLVEQDPKLNAGKKIYFTGPVGEA
jgi:hypothetical protein